MKISYITNVRIPTEKAHGYQIIKMCEEFSKQNVSVKLIVPLRKSHIKDDPFVFYNVEKNFEIIKIGAFDFFILQKYIGKLSFFLESFYFFFKLILKEIDKESVIYSRDPQIALLFSMRGFKTVFEAHRWPQSKVIIFKFFLRKIFLIVCNSNGTGNEFSKNGFNNVLIAPNGVDLEKFDIKESQEVLRKVYNLPLNKKIVMYVGHLYRWKGVDMVIETALKMKNDNNTVFVLIGGTNEDVKKYLNIVKTKSLKNVIILGHKKKKDIPKYLKCSDILLLPNIPVSEESTKYTSPIKMFEYMASNRPIIASNLPSIGEILNEGNSFLVEPGNVSEIFGLINKIYQNDDLCAKISKQAYSDVLNFSWENRVIKIKNNIK